MDTQSPMEQENAGGLTTQDRELAEAKRQGLLIQFNEHAPGIDRESPTSIAGAAVTQQEEMNELGRLDNVSGKNVFCSDEELSDDDLL